MRKPVGITVPYREVGYQEPIKLLEQKVKELEKRIERLENENSMGKGTKLDGAPAART
jgi:hypothetical protein